MGGTERQRVCELLLLKDHQTAGNRRGYKSKGRDMVPRLLTVEQFL